MNNYSNQFVVIIFYRILKFEFTTFGYFVKVFLSVFSHVKISWKFVKIIYFDTNHLIKVELKPF